MTYGKVSGYEPVIFRTCQPPHLCCTSLKRSYLLCCLPGSGEKTTLDFRISDFRLGKDTVSALYFGTVKSHLVGKRTKVTDLSWSTPGYPGWKKLYSDRKIPHLYSTWHKDIICSLDKWSRYGIILPSVLRCNGNTQQGCTVQGRSYLWGIPQVAKLRGYWGEEI